MNHTQQALATEAVPEAVAAPARKAPQGNWWRAVILAVLIAFLYSEVLLRLVQQWWDDPNFSHGFFVPLFSAFLVWQQRKQLAKLKLQASWWGLVIILAALVTLIVGTLGAELFLSRSSLVLLLGGLVVYFLGWSYFRALLFPWAVLFLMIPIPTIIFNQITFPLQLLASRLAAALLPWFGVPALREGNVIVLPAISLEVAEACSGIRSLMTLGTLAIIYGYLMEEGLWRRLLLVIASVPIAVAANALRIVGTGVLVQIWNPEKALGFFHEFSGWLIFMVSLVMLLGVHSASRLLLRPRTKEG